MARSPKTVEGDTKKKSGKPVIAGKQLTVALTKLAPNNFNYNEQTDFVFEKTKKSLQEFGFVDPIVVRKLGSKYEIIGGEHRWRAAKEVGFTEVPIMDLGTITDGAAKKLCIVLNETKGRPNTDALAAIISDLTKEGIDMEVLPYTDDELTAFDEMANLGFDEGELNSGNIDVDIDEHASHAFKKDGTLEKLIGFDMMIPEERDRFLKVLMDFAELDSVESGRIWMSYQKYMKTKIRKAKEE